MVSGRQTRDPAVGWSYMNSRRRRGKLLDAAESLDSGGQNVK